MAGILDKYGAALGQEGNSVLREGEVVLQGKPKWLEKEFPLLASLGASTEATKLVLQDEKVFTAVLEAFKSSDEKLLAWLLTVLYDMLREDSSCYVVFDSALKKGAPVYGGLLNCLAGGVADVYVKDKAAWLLTAIMGSLPVYFKGEQVCEVLALLKPDQNCSEQGALAAIANVLKADAFRPVAWSQTVVPSCIFGVKAKSQPASLYKCVFAIWLLSFEKGSILNDLKKLGVIGKLKEILVACHAEKVVRLTLTVLRNFLPNKDMCEEIVESHILEAVQALEYEKWRDAELYDDIRELSGLISAEVSESTNFGRYEKELNSGKLSWGFIHSSSFWGQNVMKFEQNDFRALKTLATLVMSPTTDKQTLAVACHDIGEFVALHPLGKREVAQLGIKERVMELMGFEGDESRVLRREALLCCQKIMLNRWQELDAAKPAGGK